jgi:uncharacterized membrane protein YiaA
MGAIGDGFVVIGCTTVAVGLAETRQIVDKKPTMKPILGGMIMGAFLLFIGMFNMDIAKAIAILVLVASALSNGAVVFGAVGKVTG